MAVGGQLKPLLLGPDLHASQPLLEAVPPEAGTETEAVVEHQLVEQPHVDVVEELREELDGQCGVDATPPEEGHGRGEDLEDITC